MQERSVTMKIPKALMSYLMMLSERVIAPFRSEKKIDIPEITSRFESAVMNQLGPVEYLNSGADFLQILINTLTHQDFEHYYQLCQTNVGNLVRKILNEVDGDPTTGDALINEYGIIKDGADTAATNYVIALEHAKQDIESLSEKIVQDAIAQIKDIVLGLTIFDFQRSTGTLVTLIHKAENGDFSLNLNNVLEKEVWNILRNVGTYLTGVQHPFKPISQQDADQLNELFVDEQGVFTSPAAREFCKKIITGLVTPNAR